MLGERKLRLADRYELEEGGLYLSGLQALVRIPIDQHQLDRRNGLATATLISGYEGSPLAGYDLEIGRQRELLERSGVVFRALPRLSPATRPALVALAELPDVVRGYERIKLGNVSRYRDALPSALGDLEPSPPAEPARGAR